MRQSATGFGTERKISADAERLPFAKSDVR
jgi:hypothetical protein